MTRQKVRDTIYKATIEREFYWVLGGYDRDKSFSDMGASELDFIEIELLVGYALNIKFGDYKSNEMSTPEAMEAFICGRFGVSNKEKL